MPLFLIRIGKWLLGKGLVYALVGLAAVTVLALVFFAQSSFDLEDHRGNKLAELERRAGQVYAELDRAHGRLIEIGEQIERSRRRLEGANQAIAYLDGIIKRISRFMTLSPEERAEGERQLAEARAEKAAETERLDALTLEQSRLRLDRVALSEEALSLESEMVALRERSAGFGSHLREAWATLKPILIVAIAGALLLPIAWKLFAYYAWAPLLSLGGPIRLSSDNLPPPRLLRAGVSTQISVKQGQRLWVRESFLQASDEALARKTRFLLDWSIPCACLAAGLVEMIELAAKERGGQVTISPQKRVELEVAVIEVPEGGKVVARPSSIAGLISRTGEPIRIQRRWRLLHPQAWLTFQFRYFVFEGPCALVVAGVRGVRFEMLDTETWRGRRSNQIATIGFTPDLAYGVVRAETFWSYFRGYNPLFDDVFRGKGVFLCQEISEEESSRASQFWSGFWSGALKIVGI